MVSKVEKQKKPASNFSIIIILVSFRGSLVNP